MHKGERGFTMLEVVIAIGLLGIIAISILAALSTASAALIIADRKATAESIARTQMEDIKNQDYINYSLELSDEEREPDFYEKISIPDEMGDCTLEIKVEPIDPSNHQPYETTANPDVYEADDGIQLITVTVTYYILGSENREVERQFILEDYKRQ
jgi:type II secretory pathway pseudopilin PulG